MQFTNFDQIKISVASPQVMREWSYGEVKNQKLLIIELCAPKETDFFAKKYSELQKNTNVIAENLKAFVIKA